MKGACFQRLYMNNNDYNNRSRNSADRANKNNNSNDFQRQYEQQLHRYSQMDGNDYDKEINLADLEFHSPEELDSYESGMYNPVGNGVGNPNGSRTPTYSQRTGQSQRRPQPQRQSAQYSSRRNSGNQNRTNKRDNHDLQFGSNNSARNKNANYGSVKNTKKQSPKNKRGNNKRVNDNKKKSPIKRFFKWLVIILLLIVIIAELLIYRYVNMINIVDTKDRLYTNASMYDDDIMNVLVIGSDSRSLEEQGRTDSMILLSINKKSNELVMTSFMRDMYVEIPNNGWSKLNAANVYGGPELLMDTIEKNFDIRVDKYVYIDFYSFVDIVDAVGGIELDISDEEAAGMKAPMAEQNKIMGKKKGTDYLKSGGKLTVNGNQALAYARLRYVGNADFERTERQRTVISKIMEKAVTFNPFKIDKFAKASLSHITTNMSKTELQILANRLPFILQYDTKELRIPEEGAYSYGYHDGQSTLDVDFGLCQQTLKKKIYS